MGNIVKDTLSAAQLVSKASEAQSAILNSIKHPGAVTIEAAVNKAGEAALTLGKEAANPVLSKGAEAAIKAAVPKELHSVVDAIHKQLETSGMLNVVAKISQGLEQVSKTIGIGTDGDLLEAAKKGANVAVNAVEKTTGLMK